MADFSQMSDEELEKIAGTPPAVHDVSSMSDEDLERIAANPSIGHDYLPKESVGQKILGGVESVGKFVDSYTGAPTRAAFTARNPIEAAGKFVNQLGANPDKAPTPEDITGLRDNSLGSKAANLLAGSVLDVSNLIPAEAVASGIGKLGSMAGKLGAKGVGEAAHLGTNLAGSAIGKISEDAEHFIKGYANPKQAEDWSRMQQIAKSNNIDPSSLSSSVEFGPHSFISRAENNYMAGTLGQNKREAHFSNLKKIDNAVENRINNIRMNQSIDPEVAGAEIAKNIQEGKQKYLGQFDITREKVLKYAPGFPIDGDEYEKVLSKVEGIRRKGIGLVQRGLTPDVQASGQAMIKLADQFENVKPTMKQFKDQLDFIGNYAYGNEGKDLPLDIKELRDLYGEMNGAFTETVRKHVNPEFADELVSNNAAINGFLKKYEPIEDLVNKTNKNKIAPETFLDRITGDSSKIDALKSTLSPEGLRQAQAAYLNKIISKNKDNGTDYVATLRRIRNDDAAFRGLFSPNEQKEITDLLELGQRHGVPREQSSTATFNDLMGSLSRGIVSDKVIERLKSRARGNPLPKAIETEASELVKGQSGAVDPKVMAYITQRMLGKRDNKISQTLKGAQVLGSGAGRDKIKIDQAGYDIPYQDDGDEEEKKRRNRK